MDINYSKNTNENALPSEEFPKQYFVEISVFSLAIGLTLGSLQLFQRIDLEIPWIAYFVSTLLLFCFTGMPIIVNRLNCICFQNPHSVFLFGCMVWLLMLLSALIIGGYAVFFFLITALLIVKCIWNIRLNWITTFALIFIGVLLGAYLYLQLHKVVYINAFTPEFLSKGVPSAKAWMSEDSYMHIAITHMILKHGVASTGLDGLTPTNYHVGSHYLFATLSKLADVKPAMSYMINYYVLILPMGFYSLLWATRTLSSTKSNKAYPSILVCLGFILCVDTLGSTGYYISESFFVSIILALWLLPFFLTDTINGTSPLMWLARFSAVCSFFLLYSLKISTGAVLAATVFWVVMCFEKRSVLKYFQLVILVIVSLISIRYFYPVYRNMPKGQGEGVLFYISKFNPMDYFFERPEAMAAAFLPALVYWLLRSSRMSLHKGVVPTERGGFLSRISLTLLAGLGLLSCFYWPVAREEDAYRYLGIFFSIACLVSLYLRTKPEKPFSREVTASIFIVLFSFSPSILGLIGHNEFWFVYCAIWLILPMLIPQIIEIDWFSGIKRGEGRRNYFKIVFLLLAVVYLGLVIKNVAERIPKWINKVVHEVPMSLYGQKNLTNMPVKISDDTRDIIVEGFLHGLIEEINNLNTNEERMTVYMSPFLDEFWQSPSRVCYSAGWIVPALTGVPLVFGTPTQSSGCKFPKGFGYANYDYAPEAAQLNESDICLHVMKKSFNSVYMVFSLDNLKQNQFVDCNSVKTNRRRSENE